MPAPSAPPRPVPAPPAPLAPAPLALPPPPVEMRPAERETVEPEEPPLSSARYIRTGGGSGPGWAEVVRRDWRAAAEQLTCAVVNTALPQRARRVGKLLDLLEAEIRDDIIEGVEDWVVQDDLAAECGPDCGR